MLRCFLALVAISCFVQSETRAADWPQHLGPNRNGLSAETGLLKSWPTAGPKEVWRVAGGVGMSGLAISGGKLVTMIQKSGKQWVAAYDAKTGKAIWETAVAPTYRNSMGPGPRATPTVTQDAIFAFSGEGILTAIKKQDGEILWSQNVIKKFGGKVADYGMASSPLVVDGKVIVTVGTRQATVVAYETKTGKLAWQSGRGASAGYSSPTVLTISGRKQVVVFNGVACLGVEPKTGTTLWKYPYKTDYDCNIATPLEVDGKLFLSAAENHGSVLLDLKPDGDRFTVSEVWKSFGSSSSMRNEWQTSMLVGGYLYGFDNVGSAGPVTHFNCVNAKTGERVWQKLRFGKGNGIAADGKIFISTRKGELVVLQATPKGFSELGRKTVIETTRQAPAISNGLLYLRDDAEIVCFDVRAN